MLSQGRKGQLLQYINDKEFSGAVIYINNLLKKYLKEEVKKFICGPEFAQAFKRLHDEFMKENSENIPVKNDQIQNINIKEYIDVSDDWGMSLLSHAAESGFLDVVDLLCKIGADVNHVNDNGFTPVFLAADYSHQDVSEIETEYFLPNDAKLKVVEYLIGKGANMFIFEDGKGKKGYSYAKNHNISPPKSVQESKCIDSVLHFAARNNQPRLLYLCIQHIKDKNPNQYKGSGFHASRYQLSLEMLFNMKDINGKTALDLAEDNSPEVANILIEELSKLKKPERMYAVTGVQAGCSMQK